METLSLFGDDKRLAAPQGKTAERLERLDLHGALRKKILPFCRLKYSEIWEDPVSGHRVGVLDATQWDDVKQMLGDEKTGLVINDPPYNTLFSLK